MRALIPLLLAFTAEAAAHETEQVHRLLETESSAFDFRVRLSGFFGYYQKHLNATSKQSLEKGGRLAFSLGYRSRHFGIYYESDLGLTHFNYRYSGYPETYADNQATLLSGANWISGYHFVPITESLELELSLSAGEMHFFGTAYNWPYGDFYCSFAVKSGIGIQISITPSVAFSFGAAYTLKKPSHREQMDSAITDPQQYIEPLMGFSFLM